MKKTSLLFCSAVFAVVLCVVRAAQTQKPPSSVVLIESAKVTSVFEKGGPLLENSDFKIQAGRRDKAGTAELHVADTDIFHILEGSATFVTGGTPVDPETVSPGEIRAKEIKGGESHRLSKGDVIVIPHGVPHWFKEVHGPLLYYVVKVTDKANAKAAF